MQEIEPIKIFKALSSEENLILLVQIIKKPSETTKIKSDLTKMPLNRRLNILKDAGLIKRERVGKTKSELFNKPTELSKSLFEKVIGKDKVRYRKEDKGVMK